MKEPVKIHSVTLALRVDSRIQLKKFNDNTFVLTSTFGHAVKHRHCLDASEVEALINFLNCMSLPDSEPTPSEKGV